MIGETEVGSIICACPEFDTLPREGYLFFFSPTKLFEGFVHFLPMCR